ncbi:ribonuclease H-like domain-containing protein [Emticicia sp. C21]|uniref:ribonuclease H-like domain-containing protein n=1 Tax=Emticicia sp. C21 TaxID=2302915 RepID=UPI000E341223|nr:ribonuclease H-like domain-containing protein [Emticicia sp. C21]RFS16047.1 3'-5' exonuclease [Emticicia sp. C21]
MVENTAKFLRNILFIDIETVSQEAHLDALDSRLKQLWLKKASYFQNVENLSNEEIYLKRSSIYAEFGKIICIGIGGIFSDDNDELALRVKMIRGETEMEILKEFKNILEKHKAGASLMLCAHNGKEFDFPYICRRMLVNEITLPRVLQVSGKKPWEINHIDTLDLWKFGDYKNYTSLDLLAAIFDIPGGETEVSGELINDIYYKEKDKAKIEQYCAEYIVVLTQLYMKMNNWSLINENNIEVIL